MRFTPMGPLNVLACCFTFAPCGSSYRLLHAVNRRRELRDNGKAAIRIAAHAYGLERTVVAAEQRAQCAVELLGIDGVLAVAAREVRARALKEVARHGGRSLEDQSGPKQRHH